MKSNDDEDDGVLSERGCSDLSIDVPDILYISGFVLVMLYI